MAKMYLENNLFEKVEIANVSNMNEAFVKIKPYSQSPYLRFWIEEVHDRWSIRFDFGSWSEFMVIDFDSYEAATAFIDTAKLKEK